MNRKKILLAYITEDSGHHRAALAIGKAVVRLNAGGVEVMSVNFLEYLHPLTGFFLERAYLRMLERNPRTWEYLYDNPEVYYFLEKWVGHLATIKFFKLKSLLKKFKPDVICCTQAFPALIMAHLKERIYFSSEMATTPVVGVLTDYSPHRYWVHSGIDLYAVPSREVAEVLISRGVKPEKIKDFGIPIDPKFVMERVDKKAVMKKMGLAESRPVILLMGGGRGLGPIREVVNKLTDGFCSSFSLLVVCGRNAKLQKEIQRGAVSLNYPIKVLGYADNIHELMRISSLIVTKPGGQTISEALACGLPMVLINPIPGQEVRNAQVLTRENVAVLADDSEDAVCLIPRLLSDRETCERMRNQAGKFAKPDASLAIAYALIKGWD